MVYNEYIITTVKEVEEFMYSFDKPIFSKIARAVELLEFFGKNLYMPHSKKVDKDLFELRIRGKKEIRIFYAFLGNKIFLLHGFVKKSEKIPLKEIRLAKVRFACLT